MNDWMPEVIDPIARSDDLHVAPFRPDDATPGTRDIGYYEPSGVLVLYYRDVGYWNGIVRLGRFLDPTDLVRSQTGTFTAELRHGDRQ